MTGHTTGDSLRYPDDVDQPADSPNAFQQLATDVQTALNADQVALDTHTADIATKMAITPTSALVAPASGWSNADTPGYGQPTVWKFGRLVIASGLLVRTGPLIVADNSSYAIGTVPAGYRPIIGQRASIAWVAISADVAQLMSTQIIVNYVTGVLSVISNVNGSLDTGHWVSLGGLAWVTP